MVMTMLETREVISSRCWGDDEAASTGGFSGSFGGRADTAAAAASGRTLSVLPGTTGIDTGMAVLGTLPNGQDRMADRLQELIKFETSDLCLENCFKIRTLLFLHLPSNTHSSTLGKKVSKLSAELRAFDGIFCWQQDTYRTHEMCTVTPL